MDKRIGLVPVAWLALLHVGAAGAGFLAPYDPAEQDRSAPLAPPTPIHFRDPEGAYHARPFVCAGGNASRLEDCQQRFPVRFFVSGPGRSILGLFRSGWRLVGVSSPGGLHLMGTDAYGRDQLSRFLYGGQVSLLRGLLACAISMAAASLLGMLAGYFGGWVDDALMGAAEISLALPWLYLLVAVRALLPFDEPPRTAFLIICLLLGLAGWARPARLIRATALAARERAYVLASRNFGASSPHILRRHILPQLLPVCATQSSLLIPRYILAEVTLSFLGLGVNEPVPSWGNMLAPLQHYSALIQGWWLFLPALILVPTSLAYFSVAKRLATES